MLIHYDEMGALGGVRFVTWLRPFFIKMTTPRYHPARHLNKHGAAQHALSRDGGTAARTGRSPQPPMTAQNLLSLTPATTEPHTTAPVSQPRWRSPRTDHAVNTATCGRTSPARHFKHSPQQRQQERSESAGGSAVASATSALSAA